MRADKIRRLAWELSKELEREREDRFDLCRGYFCDQRSPCPEHEAPLLAEVRATRGTEAPEAPSAAELLKVANYIVWLADGPLEAIEKSNQHPGHTPDQVFLANHGEMIVAVEVLRVLAEPEDDEAAA